MNLIGEYQRLKKVFRSIKIPNVLFNSELQGPVWGYPTENAYYRDASSIDSIFGIKIPFFVIQAEDDPVSYHSKRQSDATDH